MEHRNAIINYNYQYNYCCRYIAFTTFTTRELIVYVVLNIYIYIYIYSFYPSIANISNFIRIHVTLEPIDDASKSSAI